MSKKKILLISESMSGGLRKHIIQLIRNLDQNSFEVFFIHGTKTSDEAFKREYGDLKHEATLIPCENFTRDINIVKDYQTMRFVIKKIKEIDPDIIHCHSSKAGVIGRVAAKINRVDKIFYTPHAYSFLAPEFNIAKRIFFIFIESMLSRIATTKTFNVSEGEKKEAIRAHLDKNEKFEVIYNGLPDVTLPDKKAVKRLLGLPENKIIIGNSARMTEQKNPFLFFKIAKDIQKKSDKYHFVWTGSGPLEEEMKEYVAINNFSDRVTFLGDRKDSEFIVVSYDIFFISSLYEGLPYAPIEAMRAGVPIIATNVVGNREVVFDNQNGFFINNDNDNDFFVLIDKIISDSKFSLNSYKIFKEMFILDKMIEMISQEYNAE